MAVNIEMPKLSDTMTEGTLVRWHKQKGDTVATGDVLAEVETDKATMEMEAFDDGILAEVYVKEGQKVAIGQTIALLLAPGEKREAAPPAKPEPAKAGSAKEAAPKAGSMKAPGEPAKTPSKGARPAALASGGVDHGAEKPVPGPEPSVSKHAHSAPAAAQPSGAATSDPGVSSRVKASPLAKKVAAEKGIDLSRVTGSGPGDRIVQRDVLAAAEAGSAALTAPRAGAPNTPTPPNAVPAMPAGEHDKRIPLSGMRRVIAERLLQSKTQIPHFYLNIEVDAAQLMKLRSGINAAAEAAGQPKLTVNDFVLKAAVVAAAAHPKVNAAWDGDAIIEYRSINLSVAVAVEDGLVTPVIRDAQSLSIREISNAVKDLAERARNKKLKPEEYGGGTITVSNLGSYGIESFSAIINPPQAMILSIGAIVNKPVVNERGEVVAGHRMAIGMSCDHRVVDGAIGAQYLAELRRLLDNPALMLI